MKTGAVVALAKVQFTGSSWKKPLFFDCPECVLM